MFCGLMRKSRKFMVLEKIDKIKSYDLWRYETFDYENLMF